MKKHCVAKVLLAIWEIFLYENNCNYNSYRFSYKFAFILFLSFLRNQKQESGFQRAVGLVTRSISFFFFIASRALLQGYAKFNRLLQRNFLTCYSCSCYSSMIRKIRLFSKFMTSQPENLIIAIPILPNISKSKGNQIMKFGQLIEYNMRNIFSWKIIFLVIIIC